jgi:DNA-binding response OmpR family regulator
MVYGRRHLAEVVNLARLVDVLDDLAGGLQAILACRVEPCELPELVARLGADLRRGSPELSAEDQKGAEHEELNVVIHCETTS